MRVRRRVVTGMLALVAAVSATGCPGEDGLQEGVTDGVSAAVAALIEAVRELQEGDEPLRRSLLVLACTGEEKGLLGSKYYAERPTVDMRQVVAVDI